MTKSVAIVALLSTAACTASASLTQFATRSDFNTAFTNALFEDFEEANIPDGSAGTTSELILDSNTSNGIFSTGDIVEGLRLTIADAPAGGPSDNLFVSSLDFANYTSHAISYNYNDTVGPEITIDLTNNNVFGFAMDVTGNPENTLVAVDVYADDMLLGSFELAGTGAGTFLGFSSDTNIITRVTLTGIDDYFGVDNIAFAVPAPGTAGIIGIGLLSAIRRRR